VRSLWTRFRTRELLWGVAYGSFAAVLFDTARKWLSTLWASGSGTAPISNPSSQAPIAVAMIAAFCLIFPRFCRKSACLFRSWKAGLIRGTTLIAWFILRVLVSAKMFGPSNGNSKISN
jgi:hypothetical protein